jgi:hypothetical protein
LSGALKYLHENITGCAGLDVDTGDLVVQVAPDVGARSIWVEDVDAVALEVYLWAELYSTGALHDRKLG